MRALLLLALTACGPLVEDRAPAADVDPLKELLIVDEAVMQDAASSNARDGALSFRHTMERLSAHAEDAPETALGWLETWAAPRAVCGWLRDRPENRCDATCAGCAERKVDLTRAPFRLIAVSNRIDLPEGRLVFALTNGPADDPSSGPLPVTAIAEFRLDGGLDGWASRWHALGAHAAFDADYVRQLTDLTECLVSAEHLAQIRVNDGATMHEMHLDKDASDPRARLVLAKLRRTPAPSLDDTGDLAAFVNAHAAAVLTNEHDLPDAMMADRITPSGTWRLPGVDEGLRAAFARSTCNGCHGGESPVIDGAFHVSPMRHGTAKLSPFLFDPDHPGTDELTRRAALLAKLAN